MQGNETPTLTTDDREHCASLADLMRKRNEEAYRESDDWHAGYEFALADLARRIRSGE